MRHHVPELRLGSLLSPQSHLEEKFGGLPWGLPRERWPRCGGCGKPLTLLAQFCHHPGRLDLGAPGRVLYLFQCERPETAGLCETWASDSGANAVLILEATELTASLTQPPEPGTPVAREARVQGWTPGQDPFTEADFPCFFEWDAYGDLADAAIDEVTSSTKLGGVPYWIQGPEGEAGSPWRWVGQIDSLAVFDGPVPEGQEAPDIFRHEDGTWSYELANFGDAGMGYLYVNPDPANPSGLFIWQCG